MLGKNKKMAQLKEVSAIKHQILTAQIILCICLSLCLIGCSELDEEAIPDSNVITDEVGILQIEAPGKVMVYKTQEWKTTAEELQEIFLNGEIVAVLPIKDTGERYQTEYEEEREELFFGDSNKEKNRPTHFYYHLYDWDYNMLVYKHEQCEELCESFNYTSCLPDKVRIEPEEYQKALKQVEEYMTELDYPEYAVRTAAKLESGNGVPDFYLMFLEQIVDDIPLSSVKFPIDANLGWVYDVGFNKEIYQYDSTVQVCISDDGRILKWTADGGVIPTEEVGEYRIISAPEAYQKVQQVYEEKNLKNTPRLQLAELQYKSLKKDGCGWLVPVWTFGVREVEVSEEYGETENWVYYVVDAISGEFFTDISWK